MVNKFREIGMDLVQNTPLIKKAMKDVVDDQSLKYEWETAWGAQNYDTLNQLT